VALSGHVVATAEFVGKELKLTSDRIYFNHMVAENDAFVVKYSVQASDSEVTVRVSKSDGSVTRASQNKAP